MTTKPETAEAFVERVLCAVRLYRRRQDGASRRLIAARDELIRAEGRERIAELEGKLAKSEEERDRYLVALENASPFGEPFCCTVDGHALYGIVSCHGALTVDKETREVSYVTYDEDSEHFEPGCTVGRLLDDEAEIALEEEATKEVNERLAETEGKLAATGKALALSMDCVRRQGQHIASLEAQLASARGEARHARAFALSDAVKAIGAMTGTRFQAYPVPFVRQHEAAEAVEKLIAAQKEPL